MKISAMTDRAAWIAGDFAAFAMPVPADAEMRKHSVAQLSALRAALMARNACLASALQGYRDTIAHATASPPPDTYYDGTGRALSIAQKASNLERNL